MIVSIENIKEFDYSLNVSLYVEKIIEDNFKDPKLEEAYLM